jgi:hypothetical protein
MAVDRQTLGWLARVLNQKLAACSSISPKRARTPLGRCRKVGAQAALRAGATGSCRAFDGAADPGGYDTLRRAVARGAVEAQQIVDALTSAPLAAR